MFYGQFPCLNFRDVENIVDDAEQMLAGALDLLDVVALARRQLGLQRQIGHADDGVHRRAYLMAHVGEKIRFGEVGFFRRRAGLLQFDVVFLQQRIQPFSLGDIARSGKHALQFPVAVIKGGCIK